MKQQQVPKVLVAEKQKKLLVTLKAWEALGKLTGNLFLIQQTCKLIAKAELLGIMSKE